MSGVSFEVWGSDSQQKIVRRITIGIIAPVLSELQLFAYAVAAGVLIRTTLVLSGQQWAKTYSNTVTYLLLPVVGLVIVQVISNSIALSLGMIGALSIVRFRHPVKSPLELVIYFLLLTVGVALSTRPYLALLLVVLSAIVISVVAWIARLRARRGLATFPLSPADGDRSFLLEVAGSEPIDMLNECPELVFAHEDREAGIYTYKLAFAERSELDSWRLRLQRVGGISQMSGDYL